MTTNCLVTDEFPKINNLGTKILLHVMETRRYGLRIHENN